jgi:hypothetical protein
MRTRPEFLAGIAELELTHAERAIALLWFYRQTQEFDDRTPRELAADLHEEGFPKPNVTRLRSDLQQSCDAARGRQSGSFQIDLRRVADLSDTYSTALDLRRVDAHDTIFPAAAVAGTRSYLERFVYQINGAYEFGFYDACAVLCRRLITDLLAQAGIGT